MTVLVATLSGRDRSHVARQQHKGHREVDATFKSVHCAVQGCMNNFTFGDSGITYYETIAGGAGAGPGWHGRSGVHTHMTNTRITDPEILERRYPVVLHEFSLRKGSGGAGKFRGGDGVIREVSRRWTLVALTCQMKIPSERAQEGLAISEGVMVSSEGPS